ncbi:MAG: hypothetical protein H6625_03895 [Bdellovibrionaceae bacterium]|nr:hypothetical protein [Pseudobdellovibrionaceae bacterium]
MTLFKKLKIFDSWSKETLLFSTVLPAGLNFLISFFAIKYFGLEMFGLWLIWKTACQLTSNIGPGLGVSLSILIPEYKNSNIIRMLQLHAIIQKFSILWLFFAGSLAFFGFYYFIEQPLYIVVLLLFFWLGLHVDGYTGSVARGYKNSKAILFGTFAEAFGTILSLIAVYMKQFEFFIATQGLKMWLRAFFQYLPTSLIEKVNFVEQKQIVIESIQKGLPLVFRGWVQAAFQYGDKLILGLLFGPLIAGTIGLGGMLSLPVIMISSATASWLLPVLITEQESNLSKILYRQIMLLFISSALISVYIFTLPLFFKDSSDVLDIILLSYIQATILSIFTIGLTKLVAEGKRWRAVFINFFIFLVILLTMYLGWYLKYSINEILGAVCILLVSILFVFVQLTRIIRQYEFKFIIILISYLLIQGLVLFVIKSDFFTEKSRIYFTIITTIVYLLGAYLLRKIYSSKKIYCY